MSKLFKLKEWFTLEESAKHLSTIFGEEVLVSDVIRLGLDGHLKISVNFVNGVRVKVGEILPIEDAYVDFPEIVKKFIGDSTFDHKKIILGTIISDSEVVSFRESGVSRVYGLWDLPLIGGEHHDLAALYYQLTNGPEYDLHTLDGAFVEKPCSSPRVICQIQEHFEDNEYCGQIPNPEDRNDKSNFYPASGLPDDCVLVVRREALIDLQNKMQNQGAGEVIGTKTKNVYIKTIYALTVALIGKLSGKKTKDAAVLLAKLDELGVKHPINSKTLADILEEGVELSD